MPRTPCSSVNLRCPLGQPPNPAPEVHPLGLRQGQRQAVAQAVCPLPACTRHAQDTSAIRARIGVLFGTHRSTPPHSTARARSTCTAVGSVSWSGVDGV